MQLSLKTLIGSFDDLGNISDFYFCQKLFGWTFSSNPEDNDLTAELKNVEILFQTALQEYLSGVYGIPFLNTQDNLENFQIQIDRKVSTCPKLTNSTVDGQFTNAIWVTVVYECTFASLNNKSGSESTLKFAQRPLGQ